MRTELCDAVQHVLRCGRRTHVEVDLVTVQGRLDCGAYSFLFAPDPKTAVRRSAEDQDPQLLWLRCRQVPRDAVDVGLGTRDVGLARAAWSARACRSDFFNSCARLRSAATPSDCSALVTLASSAASSRRYPVALVDHRLASLPAVAASRCLRSASFSLVRAVEALLVFPAAARAFAASVRLLDSLIRYSPAFFSASIRCLRLRSNWPHTVDLAKKNLTAFEKALQPYIDVATKVPGTRAATKRGASAQRQDLASIRSWAQENGIQIAPRGRISKDVIAQYEAAR